MKTGVQALAVGLWVCFVFNTGCLLVCLLNKMIKGVLFKKNNINEAYESDKINVKTKVQALAVRLRFDILVKFWRNYGGRLARRNKQEK